MQRAVTQPVPRQRLTLIGIIGACCLWLPEEMALGLSANDGHGLFSSGYPLFLIAATVATCGLLATRTEILRARRGLVAFCSASQATGTLAMLVSLHLSLPPSCFALATAIAGIGFGLLSLVWGEFFADIPLRDIKRIMFGTALLQGALSTALSLLPQLDAAVAMLPLASGLILKRISAESQAFGIEEARLPRGSIRLPVLFSLGIAAMSVGRGSMVALSRGLDFPSDPLSQVTILLFSIVALWALLFAVKRLDYTPAWRVISTIMITSFITLASFGDDQIDTAALVTDFGYALFEYIVWIASIDVARYSAHAPVRFIAFTAVFTFGGQCLGASATNAALLSLGPSGVTIIAGIMASLLVFSVIWLAPSEAVSQLFALSEGRTKAPANPSGLGTLIERFGLTARELDVAELLASGRSARFIQDQLNISESTTWTHIRHIYQKMGVSNRQAFLTLMEEIAQGEK